MAKPAKMQPLHWVLFGSPEPKMVGFCNLVRIAYGRVSKNVAVKIFRVSSKCPTNVI